MILKEKKDEILLTRPFMPPREEFDSYLRRIWESGKLTNDGPIHAEFEEALCRHLGVRYISLFANGTLALLFALKALDLKGDIITTPFTSIATFQAIHWNRLNPVFVDIDPTDLNIHPDRLEAAITPDTCAFLPVHVFGNPCDVNGIREVATRHHIRTVYDAAHCFDVRFNGIPLCDFGDLSVLSFHATKVFSCVEGGAVVCHDRATKEHIDALRILKLKDGIDNLCCGLNAKMNEIQAAYGMVQLNHIDRLIKQREEATHEYRGLLSEIPGIRMVRSRNDTECNYTYLPVIIDPEKAGTNRDEVASALAEKGIITRKYFYPLVSNMPELSTYKTADLPVAEEISERILCLPLYPGITRRDITFITDSIRQLSR